MPVNSTPSSFSPNNSNQPSTPVKSLSIKAMANNGGTVVDNTPANNSNEKVEEDINPAWNAPFTNDSLKKVWIDYAISIQANNPYLHSILSNNIAVKGNGNELVLNLQNPMQESEVLREKPALFMYLKKQLQNANLSLTTNIVVDNSGSTKAYTSSDKLKVMMEQNPSLAELKRLFDLDLE